MTAVIQQQQPIPCGQTTPQGSVHASNSPTHVPLPHASQFNIPPTPYVNQMPVNQHIGTQPALILPKMSTHKVTATTKDIFITGAK